MKALRRASLIVLLTVGLVFSNVLPLRADIFIDCYYVLTFQSGAELYYCEYYDSDHDAWGSFWFEM